MEIQDILPNAYGTLCTVCEIIVKHMAISQRPGAEGAEGS